MLVTTTSFAAVTSVTPLTWNIVGLDSNSPPAGPNRFPVGARVCGTTGPVTVDFVWEDPVTPSYINLSGSSPSSVSIDIPASGCADAYFEVEVTRTSLAYDTARGYYIRAGGVTSPRPRELYVEQLVSQARNGIVDLQYGTSVDSLTSVPVGGSFSLTKGETYFVRMTSYTAPGGYEQLETFSTLPNTIFQVLSVETTYTADTTTNVSSPNDKLYGDACYWENDPGDPNYLACNSDGKIGGNMTVTYQVKILDILSGAQPIYSLVYDLSGASFHYNSDYASGARNVYLVDPSLVTISKKFVPASTYPNGTATLVITLSNPNAGPVSGVTVSDDFTAVVVTPAGGTMTVAATPKASSTCGGSFTNYNSATLVAGDDGIRVTGATVPGGGSCTIKVDVTADSEGSYLNTAALAVGTTTNTASATLLIDENAFPPPFPSPCTGSEVTLASWNFDNLTAGQSVPPLYNSTKHTDVSYTNVAYTSSTTVTGTSSVTNAQAQSTPNSWVGSGWNTATDGLPTLSSTRFEFSVDSSKFGQVFVELYGRIGANGNWTGNNNNLRIWRNGTILDADSATAGVQDNNNLSTTWTLFNRAGSTSYAADTTFTVQAYYRHPNKTSTVSTLFLDNVAVKGCPIPSNPPSPPTLAKVFTQSPIAVNNGVSTLTFTVTNPAGNSSALSQITFTDRLPDGMEVAATPAAATTCSGGTLTNDDTPPTALSAGDTVIKLGGASLAAGGSCTASVNVRATAASNFENASEFISALESGANKDATTGAGVARASLRTLLPPTIDKSFDPVSIYNTANGGLSTLTFAIANPNLYNSIGSVAFSDTFPSDLVVAATPNAGASGCGPSPTWSPAAGSGTVSFSNGTIAAGGTCTLSVDVTAATADYYTNTSGAVTHRLDDAVAGAAAPFGTDTAVANLLVRAPTPKLALLKQISEDSVGPWGTQVVVALPATVYYRFNVENTGDVALSQVGVSDPAAWVDPSACSWQDGDGDPLTAPFALPVVDTSDQDHIATCVIGPVAAQSGTWVNTASASATHNSTPVSSNSSTAKYSTSALSLIKNAVETYFSVVGDTLNYSYTVSYNGATLAGPVTVTDNRAASVTCPALTTIGNKDSNFDAGETLVCTATYTVTEEDVANRSVTNVARARIGTIYSPTDSHTVNTGMPLLTILKSASSASASPGDQIVYTIQLHNTGTAVATEVILQDRLSPYAAFKLDFDDTAPANPFVLTDITTPPDTAGLTMGTPEYSDDHGATEPWSYSLVNRGDGYDNNVTNWRIPLSGSLSVGGSVSLQYKAIVK